MVRRRRIDLLRRDVERRRFDEHATRNTRYHAEIVADLERLTAELAERERSPREGLYRAEWRDADGRWHRYAANPCLYPDDARVFAEGRTDYSRVVKQGRTVADDRPVWFGRLIATGLDNDGVLIEAKR